MDIYNRMEKSFLQLNASYVYSHNWANASILNNGLELIRAALEQFVIAPITYFPIIPQFVLNMETFLHNPNETNLGNWKIDYFNASEGNSTTLPTFIEYPNFNFPDQSIIYEVAVWASDDGGSDYNLTLEQLEQ